MTRRFYADRLGGDQVRITTQPHGTGHLFAMAPDEARSLATDLLGAAEPNGAGLGIVISCPLCEGGLVTIQYDPGYPGMATMPNGDPGFPPEAPSIEGLKATCDCWTADRLGMIFDGVEVVQWLCQCVVNPGAGRGPSGNVCLTWNDEGQKCSNCGCDNDVTRHGRISTRTEPHPVYTILESLVTAWYGVNAWYEAEAMDKAFAVFNAATDLESRYIAEGGDPSNIEVD